MVHPYSHRPSLGSPPAKAFPNAATNHAPAASAGVAGDAAPEGIFDPARQFTCCVVQAERRASSFGDSGAAGAAVVQDLSIVGGKLCGSREVSRAAGGASPSRGSVGNSELAVHLCVKDHVGRGGASSAALLFLFPRLFLGAAALDVQAPYGFKPFVEAPGRFRLYSMVFSVYVVTSIRQMAGQIEPNVLTNSCFHGGTDVGTQHATV